MLTADHIVGAEDDRGSEPHAVRALQRGDGVVVVSLSGAYFRSHPYKNLLFNYKALKALMSTFKDYGTM